MTSAEIILEPGPVECHDGSNTTRPSGSNDQPAGTRAGRSVKRSATRAGGHRRRSALRRTQDAPRGPGKPHAPGRPRGGRRFPPTPRRTMTSKADTTAMAATHTAIDRPPVGNRWLLPRRALTHPPKRSTTPSSLWPTPRLCAHVPHASADPRKTIRSHRVTAPHTPAPASSHYPASRPSSLLSQFLPLPSPQTPLLSLHHHPFGPPRVRWRSDPLRRMDRNGKTTAVSA